MKGIEELANTALGLPTCATCPNPADAGKTFTDAPICRACWHQFSGSAGYVAAHGVANQAWREQKGRPRMSTKELLAFSRPNVERYEAAYREWARGLIRETVTQ